MTGVLCMNFGKILSNVMQSPHNTTRVFCTGRTKVDKSIPVAITNVYYRYYSLFHKLFLFLEDDLNKNTIIDILKVKGINMREGAGSTIRLLLLLTKIRKNKENCGRHTGPVLHHRQVVFTCC